MKWSNRAALIMSGMSKLYIVTAVLTLLSAGGIAHATITYTVDGWGSTQYPGLLTPPADAPWGVDGYPGDTLQLLGFTGTLELGSSVKQINTLLWTIDYTYGGTPEPWPDMNLAITKARNISLDGGQTGSLIQAGNLRVIAPAIKQVKAYAA